MAKKIKVKSINMLVNGMLTTLDYEEDGYYLGSIPVGVGDVSFHVEAVAVTVQGQKRIVGGKYHSVNVVVTPKNPAYQNRIDNWQDKNEGLTPKLVEDDGGPYFVNIEAYAA